MGRLPNLNFCSSNMTKVSSSKCILPKHSEQKNPQNDAQEVAKLIQELQNDDQEVDRQINSLLEQLINQIVTYLFTYKCSYVIDGQFRARLGRGQGRDITGRRTLIRRLFDDVTP